jgi:hypothetical protein
MDLPVDDASVSGGRLEIEHPVKATVKIWVQIPARPQIVGSLR